MGPYTTQGPILQNPLKEVREGPCSYLNYLHLRELAGAQIEVGSGFRVFGSTGCTLDPSGCTLGL